MMHCLFLGCLFALVFGIYTKVPAQLICSYILNIISASILIICIHLWRKR